MLEGLRGLVGELALSCGFAPRQTIYLAAGEGGPRELLLEAALWERAGLPAEFVEYRALNEPVPEPTEPKETRVRMFGW